MLSTALTLRDAIQLTDGLLKRRRLLMSFLKFILQNT